MGKLTKKQKEKMAVEIRDMLIEEKAWIDTSIYFNGKRFSTYDSKTGKYYYNDKDHLIVEEDVRPGDYFEFVSEDDILCMSFEGPLYDVLNYGDFEYLERKLNAIFDKYGVFYELGNSWNLSCSYI